jgi:hypothetical protein
MRCGGIARAQQRARANTLEREQRASEESAEASTIPDLWAAIYRLQSRNRGGGLSDRIRVLVEEEPRRRGGALDVSDAGRGA